MFGEIKAYLILGLALLVMALSIALNLQQAKLKAEKAASAALREQRDHARREMTAVMSIAADQTKAIAAWRQRALEEEIRRDEAVRNAERARQEFNQRIAAIVAAKTPEEAGAALQWAVVEAVKLQEQAK